MSEEQLQVVRLGCYFITAAASWAIAGILLPGKDSLGRWIGVVMLAVGFNSTVFGVGTLGKVVMGSSTGFFFSNVATLNAILMALVCMSLLVKLWGIRRGGAV